MAQFSVHRNPNAASRAAMPYLLDVQSDLIKDLGTRVVVPLCLASSAKGRLIKTLMPVFEIEGKSYAMLTPQLAGIAKQKLGAKIADVAGQRAQILAALDLLITGI
jgi:toxin CcdB